MELTAGSSSVGCSDLYVSHFWAITTVKTESSYYQVMGIEITILFDFNFIFEHLTDPFQTMFSRGGKKEQLNENVIN